jgi:flagellin
MSVASKNSQDAISLLQSAEGALNGTHSILQRMRELAVQASSDTNQDEVDRAALNAEFVQLKQEIDDIADGTTFNSDKLLDGSFDSHSSVSIDAVASTADDRLNVASITVTNGSAVADYRFDVIDVNVGRVALSTVISGNFHSDNLIWNAGAGAVNTFLVNGATITITSDSSAGVTPANIDASHIIMADTVTSPGWWIQTGSNTGDKLDISIGDMSTTALEIAGNTIDTQSHASTAITEVGDAIKAISTQRASIGAISNRLQHKINNLDLSAENLQSAESRIRDVDMASEMTSYTKNNILVQAATAMLSQANAAPQNVLQLIKQ